MVIALRVARRTSFEAEGPSSPEVSENAVFGNSYREANLNEATLRASGRIRVRLNGRLWRCDGLCRRGGYLCGPSTSADV
jgi:hypothetical protein